jgi:hypothetical protein
MLENWLLPQLNINFGEKLILEQDGAPPRYHNAVTRFLNENLPVRWIGCESPKAWPPRSPDLTPVDFFLWDCVKDQVYVSPLPNNLQELKDGIRQALESAYSFDVVRVNRGVHG